MTDTGSTRTGGSGEGRVQADPRCLAWVTDGGQRCHHPGEDTVVAVRWAVLRVGHVEPEGLQDKCPARSLS